MAQRRAVLTTNLLVAATVVALVWANSPWDDAYRRLWSSDARLWINEGLMTLFFLVVGLELKRELLSGELRDRRHAALPVAAAVGGMVVPAGIYLAINGGGSGGRGWGIPMATDVVFALGLAAVVAGRLPPSLRLFVLTLAVVDDIGALVVIAVVYAGHVQWAWIAAAVAIVAAAYLLGRIMPVFTPVFATLGVLLWLAVHASGVHATLAGVAMALVVPARASSGQPAITEVERFERALVPWTSLVVVPLFALANAGVSLSASALADAASSPVTWGVVAGLAIGKPVGISLFAWLACRLRVAALPPGVRWMQLVGVAALCGVGFTVSLFMTGLAFERAELTESAKVGVVAASLLAPLLAWLLLRRRPSE